jgi:integrase
MKLDTKKIWPGKPPTYTRRKVSIYRPSEIDALLRASTRYQRVVIELFLKTGMRMQEAMHLQWQNVDFESRIISVLEYDEFNVGIKDKAEREIPLLDDLAKMLQEYRAEHPKSRLVIGQPSNDMPNWKLLQMLKRIARRAGLNCGSCRGCKSKGKECARYTLKRFRATYTTRMLRGGVDPHTLMKWTGHEDLETVLLYLAPQEMDEARPKINAIQWT